MIKVAHRRFIEQVFHSSIVVKTRQLGTAINQSLSGPTQLLVQQAPQDLLFLVVALGGYLPKSPNLHTPTGRIAVSARLV